MICWEFSTTAESWPSLPLEQMQLCSTSVDSTATTKESTDTIITITTRLTLRKLSSEMRNQVLLHRCRLLSWSQWSSSKNVQSHCSIWQGWKSWKSYPQHSMARDGTQWTWHCWTACWYWGWIPNWIPRWCCLKVQRC